MAIFLVLICRFTLILIKNASRGFIWQTAHKICMKRQWLRVVKVILRKNIGGFILADFKTYWKATVTKTLKYWQMDRPIDLWNIIESPEWDIHVYAQLIYDNGVEIAQWGENSLVNKWSWQTGYLHAKNEFGPHLLTYF